MSDADTVAVRDKEGTCGLIMPISECDGLASQHWEDVREIIVDAVQKTAGLNLNVRLVSESDTTGVIHKRIIQNVYNDEIAICDVSGRNPNVLFELGLRTAFDRPTVIIKDEKTDYIFDTGTIEHLTYPRDLRHNLIEEFKQTLASKIAATYNAAKRDPDSVSVLKSFGTFKVVQLKQTSTSGEEAVLSMLGDIRSQLSMMRNTSEVVSRPAAVVGGGMRHLRNMIVQELVAIKKGNLHLDPKKPLSIEQKRELEAIVNSKVDGRYPRSLVRQEIEIALAAFEE